MRAISVERINRSEAAVRIKEEKGSSKSHVTLRVQQGDAKEYDVYYRLDRAFPLHHLKLHYCNHLGAEYGAVRFTFNGSGLSGAKTPNDLKLNNGDVIVAWLDKIGG